jgi:hypothetical protein
MAWSMGIEKIDPRKWLVLFIDIVNGGVMAGVVIFSCVFGPALCEDNVWDSQHRGISI